MNIIKENVDELNAVLKVKVEREDYSERVEKVLKDYRRNAKMPGFRPGKVPAGIVNKLYRVPVIIEEINKIVSESISKYIFDEKLNILGDPLPGENQHKDIDWEKQSEFEFNFDLGIAPEIEVSLNKRDKIPFYQIQIDETMVNDGVDHYAGRFGTLKPVDSVTSNVVLQGDFVQADEHGNVVERGIKSVDARFSLEAIKDPGLIKQFTGKKLNDSVVLDIKKAFPNETEQASLLKLDKKKIPVIAPHFLFTIGEISSFEKAPVSKELFDQIYGKDTIKTEEEFRDKIREELAINYNNDSDYRFRIDARDFLLKKVKINLPVEFLKRWLESANKEKFSREQIDKEFPSFEEGLKWQLIRDRIINDNNITVSEDEVNQYARHYALMQFRQYGISDVPEDQLNSYATNILKNEEERKKIYERLYENKVFNQIKDLVKIENKQVSQEKFNKLFKK